MIRLKKIDIPKVLEINFQKWTSNILAKLQRGEQLSNSDKGHYNHKEIKEALILETNEKCAYCESKLRHIAYGDIEHITPKVDSPELWFKWENLTLACDICNTNKASKNGIIDPYVNNPDEETFFCGSVIFPIPGNDCASLSIRELDLNRSELIGKRQEKIENLFRLLEVIARTENPRLKEILSADFNMELTSDKEYSALAKSVKLIATTKGLLV